VQKGSRADKAGVFVGDEVLEINGVLVDAGFPAEALNDLLDSRCGHVGHAG
jgi:predicted metalloprotease with PDZ domain